MPITSFTVAGDEVNPLFDSLEIRETVGGVSTLSCEVTSIGSPVLRFAVHDEVGVEEDGVIIFAGTVSQARERGFGGPNLYDEDGAPQIVTTITVEDWTRLAERVYVTETVAAGTTLEAFLVTLVANYFDQFGVTLHGSQVTGPNLPAMSFSRKLGLEVMKSLADATGFLWRIDYDKVLRMWQEGDLAAPFDIDEFDVPARWTGDVEVETILGDNYANRVTVVTDPVTETGRQESFTGDGVTDTFTLGYTLIQSFGIIHIYELDGVTPAGGETFGLPSTGTQWEYDAGTNQITRTIGPTDATKIYRLTFDGTFQAEAVAEDAGEIAAYGLYEHVEVRNDIASTAAAQELADAMLAERLLSGDQTVVYQTRFTAPTLRAGQEQTLTATARDITGSFIIRDIRVRAEVPVTAVYAATGLGLIRSVTAKKLKVLSGKWQNTYRDWLQLGGGGSVSVGSGGPGSGGAAPPPFAVQFNNGGVFGGDAAFVYDPVTNCLVCGGGGSSITATSPESCQVFGYNCHIVDP